MPHIGVFNRIFLEHKRHKRTIMALNSSNSPISLPSPAMRFYTGKDVFTSLEVLPQRLLSFLNSSFGFFDPVSRCPIFHVPAFQWVVLALRRTNTGDPTRAIRFCSRSSRTPVSSTLIELAPSACCPGKNAKLHREPVKQNPYQRTQAWTSVCSMN